MRKLLGALFALALLPTIASAVTYSAATVSMVVRQNNPSGKVTTTVLNNRKFLEFVSNSQSTPISDLFLGLNETTGELLVIRKSDKTIRFGILPNLNVFTTAANGTGTTQFIFGAVTVSSFTQNVTGALFETQLRNSSNKITSVKRTFSGGSNGQVITGTVVTTGKKIDI